MQSTWSVEQSRALYNIGHWSDGYFSIGDNGHVFARPCPDLPAIDLHELVGSLPGYGLSIPVVVRFANILHNRVERLCTAFEQAMQNKNYQGSYTPVYPIKVNQEYHVVKELLSTRRIGLEAGSKPELMAVLALAPTDGGMVICNGYKDSEYVRLALIGQQLGFRIHLVIEKLSELALIIRESQQMGIRPRLGVRVRLASLGTGKWQKTGGEKAKFGLSAAQLLTVVNQIRDAGLSDCLQMMHFHIGSQVANIRDIQRALGEGARYYAALHQLGMPVCLVDVGGGLGVDYDGTASRNACSINYSMQEYANNIVHELQQICEINGLPMPDIVTEAGRAMTAHHAVLITNVIDVEYCCENDQLPEPAMDEHLLLKNLREGLQTLTPHSAFEACHDAAYWLSEAQSLFMHGLIDLSQRAQAEQLYFITCARVRELLQGTSRKHRELLDELNEKLADKYFCNFSLFQSVPDAWAIDQLFPIMPLQRLQEMPDRRATLQDLTCDSDGAFEHYVDGAGIETSLPVHVPEADETYLLGIFLVGAYQEILGDMHNLFGDTFSVNVHMNVDGSYELVDPVEGDTVKEMLQYVHFDTDALHNTYRKRLQATSLSHETRQAYLRELESGLMGYTYLES